MDPSLIGIDIQIVQNPRRIDVVTFVITYGKEAAIVGECQPRYSPNADPIKRPTVLGWIEASQVVELHRKRSDSS